MIDLKFLKLFYCPDLIGLQTHFVSVWLDLYRIKSRETFKPFYRVCVGYCSFHVFILYVEWYGKLARFTERLYDRRRMGSV